jgi:hypothetical protein
LNGIGTRPEEESLITYIIVHERERRLIAD